MDERWFDKAARDEVLDRALDNSIGVELEFAVTVEERREYRDDRDQTIEFFAWVDALVAAYRER